MPERAKRRKSVEAIGRDFARAVDWETIRAATISQTEIENNLRNLEGYYVNLLEKHPKFALEVRRRIAEMLFEQAVLRQNSLSACRARLNAASRLGYTNIERKAHCHMLYAMYASARRNERVAIKIATAIANDLELSLKKRKSLLAEQCLAHAKRFLEFINSADNPKDRTLNHA